MPIKIASRLNVGELTPRITIFRKSCNVYDQVQDQRLLEIYHISYHEDVYTLYIRRVRICFVVKTSLIVTGDPTRCGFRFSDLDVEAIEPEFVKTQ